MTLPEADGGSCRTSGDRDGRILFSYVHTFLKGARAAVGLGGAARGAKGRGGHICAAWEGFDWITTFHSHTVIYNE